jgi:hypothetical protein
VAHELRLEYPCDPALRSLGRVAVIGVLLRLRTPMVAVERFRAEVEAALAAAAGVSPDPASLLSLVAKWDDDEMEVTIEGPAGTKRLRHVRSAR